MSIGKKHITGHYTLVEVMMAMGIFLIMMTIMMQFFTSAQEVWNNSSKRNMLYADARVAMNLVTREIQSMLYNNDDDGVSGIYPFWYEWTELDASLGSGEAVPTTIRTYFEDNDELPEKTDSTSYLTALNFISTTDLKPVEQGSDVCEIRYRFIPVYSAGTPNSINDIRGGKFERSCTAEYSGNPPTLTSAALYNFAANPYVATSPTATRVTSIWSNTNPPSISSAAFETVINGVYSMNFTCYVWNSGLASYYPMNTTGVDMNNNNTYSNYHYGLGTGTPLPIAIRIDMKLMDPKDLKKLAWAIYQNDTKEIDDLKPKIRTFSKVIYVGRRED